MDVCATIFAGEEDPFWWCAVPVCHALDVDAWLWEGCESGSALRETWTNRPWAADKFNAYVQFWHTHVVSRAEPWVTRHGVVPPPFTWALHTRRKLSMHCVVFETIMLSVTEGILAVKQQCATVMSGGATVQTVADLGYGVAALEHAKRTLGRWKNLPASLKAEVCELNDSFVEILTVVALILYHMSALMVLEAARELSAADIVGGLRTVHDILTPEFNENLQTVRALCFPLYNLACTLDAAVYVNMCSRMSELMYLEGNHQGSACVGKEALDAIWGIYNATRRPTPEAEAALGRFADQMDERKYVSERLATSGQPIAAAPRIFSIAMILPGVELPKPSQTYPKRA